MEVCPREKVTGCVTVRAFSRLLVDFYVKPQGFFCFFFYFSAQGECFQNVAFLAVSNVWFCLMHL